MTTFLVDYENVHANGIGKIRSNTDGNLVIIFYTDNAATLNMDLLSKLGQMRMEFIKVPAGSQSLDKHLLSYMGFLIAKSSSEEGFVIVSKDNGYRTLAEFWNNYCGREKVSILPLEINFPDTERAVPGLSASYEELFLQQMENKERLGKSSSREKQVHGVKEINNLNKKLFQILPKEVGSTVKCGQIASAVIHMYKENTSLYEMYMQMVKQFGEKDGLKYWNIVKKAL